ncbi:MAG: hypothetical protein J3Q66DRAFT_327642 [Benniella sp.]|nr:MAG: hypothetical protein J3Q66DRAFT_327642 [Benniella sp.]
MGLLKLTIAAASGAAVGPVAIVGVVTLLGFGAGGIVAGTPAAAFMAIYGGAVPAGGLCAILQSIGAGGLSAGGTTASSTIGAALVAWLI